jgi:hypothetical protein
MPIVVGVLMIVLMPVSMVMRTWPQAARVLAEDRVSTIDLTVLFSWNAEAIVHEEEPAAEEAEPSKPR